MFRFFLALLLSLAALPAFAAPPITAKDVALLARSGYSEAEIIAEVEKRQFATPINAAAEKVMTDGGTPAALIAKLKAGNFVLNPAQRAAQVKQSAEQRLALLQREQEEAAFLAQRRAQAAAIATSAATADHVLRLVEARLVKLEGSMISPYSATNLRDVRLYAFYYSASWCGPCRKVTPKIVEWYRKTKAAHPEFELIMVSSDQDETSMHDYMRKNQMPWPAIRFADTKDPTLQMFAGQSIPWLVAVSRSGDSLTKNGVNKEYLPPEEIMGAVDSMLAQLKTPGAKLKGE